MEHHHIIAPFLYGMSKTLDSRTPRRGVLAIRSGTVSAMVYDPDLRVRNGACLPHWTKEGSIYSINFRLGDSLPQGKLQEWTEGRKALTEKIINTGRKPTPTELREINELFSKKVDRYLDAGYGECWLRRDDVAQIVADALWHFNGKQYELFAWCIMPNHVHIVLQPLGDYSLRDILYSRKKFTAGKINLLLGRKGTLWQSESFDHLIRNRDDLERSVEYVWQNPEKAGLLCWKWRWMN